MLFGITMTCLNSVYILREFGLSLRRFISSFYFVDSESVTYVQNRFSIETVQTACTAATRLVLTFCIVTIRSKDGFGGD